MSSHPLSIDLGIHRVLSAMDFSSSSIKALNHAIEIARSYGAKFYLVHVVSSIGYVMVGADVQSVCRVQGRECRRADIL